jgi:hypothetical protein
VGARPLGDDGNLPGEVGRKAVGGPEKFRDSDAKPRYGCLAAELFECADAVDHGLAQVLGDDVNERERRLRRQLEAAATVGVVAKLVELGRDSLVERRAELLGRRRAVDPRLDRRLELGGVGA